ncbi:MAG: hypothetical protein WKF94_09590, partial [Solirubrobacteraceae bacterium]
ILQPQPDRTTTPTAVDPGLVGGGGLLTEPGVTSRVFSIAALVGGLIGVGALIHTARRDVAAGRDGVLCGAVIERSKYISTDGGSFVRVWARVEHPDGAFDAKGTPDVDKHDLAGHHDGSRVEVLVHPRRRRVLYWLGRA